jgi:hypothetical protein
MLAALLLHASGAHARQDVVDLPRPAGDQPAPAAAPAVEPIPLVSDAPQVSVPGSGPAIEPMPTIPASPVPALSRTEPKIVHRPRVGLIVAGGSIFVSAYILQMVLAFGVALSGIDGPPNNSGTGALLTLIPIVGPWLGPREIHEPLAPQWVLAWGLIEAGALAMVIAGIVGHDVVKEPAARKVSLAPFATPEASGLSLRLRW